MVIDGTDRLVTMATEESSVVAAVCNTARQCRGTGGFICSTSGPNMIAQVQLVNCSDPEQARLKILEHREHIKQVCDATDPILTGLGGGFRDLEVRVLQTEGGKMVIVHLVIDTRDAMGANAVNSMAESLAPEMAAWTGGKTYLRILSNLADRRIARARAVWSLEAIGGVHGLFLFCVDRFPRRCMHDANQPQAAAHFLPGAPRLVILLTGELAVL